MLSDSGNRHTGRVHVIADRSLSPTAEVGWQLSSINAAKRGGREKKRSWRKNFAQNPAENKNQGLP
jgi:hypothetical protein